MKRPIQNTGIVTALAGYACLTFGAGRVEVLGFLLIGAGMALAAVGRIGRC